ncbi:hypothetical protein O6H91_09G036000 [Diphasiastrum complanatum]|uniref:Uncharacterized protein n=1 Tax=Diphasiastrum complanatum TaxID=34168 RepID=A0ACC2CMX2_DIPCM|nr:hypothetical protein O6H91_09G036000 [Diphasiastrum complanatum]
MKPNLGESSGMAESERGQVAAGRTGAGGGVGAAVSEQDGAPALSICTPRNRQAPPSSASSPHKGLQQVELELRLLEALEIYDPAKLQGMHRHFILFGLMEYLERRLNQHFTSEEVLRLLDGFFNLEMLKPDDDEIELTSQEEDFALPPAIFELKDDSM